MYGLWAKLREDERGTGVTHIFPCFVAVCVGSIQGCDPMYGKEPSSSLQPLLLHYFTLCTYAVDRIAAPTASWASVTAVASCRRRKITPPMQHRRSTFAAISARVPERRGLWKKRSFGQANKLTAHPPRPKLPFLAMLEA